MTHIESGELQAYLDEEVAAGSRAQIDRHLRACTECATEVKELRAASSLFASLLHAADAAAPVMQARAIVAAQRTDTPRKRMAFSRSALAKAAVLMLGFAALASAAIPGSPVRAWISDALRGSRPAVVPTPAPVEVSPSAAAPAATPGTDEAALSIEPADGRVLILLSGVTGETTIRVRLVDSDRALVQTSGGAAHARFRTGPGRIEVLGIEKGEVTIEMPRSVIDARVEVDGRVLFQKDHDQLRLSEPRLPGANSEFVFKAGQ